MATTPDESFVPLTPKALAPGERLDFRVTVLSQGGAEAAPADSSKPVWSAPGTTHTPTSAHDSQVTFQRDGDRVSVIQIHCACGRVTELACVYDKTEKPK